MSDELKKELLRKEIYQKYQNYIAENFNEKYIYKLIIQDGYDQQDVEDVIKQVNAEKQQTLKKKNKYRSIKSIVLYILGTLLLCAGIALIIMGGRLGFGLIFLAVIIWINANR